MTRTARRERQNIARRTSAKWRLYDVWRAMVSRCHKPSARDYPLYGGRGIRVCERWQTFANFSADMGPKPSPSHTLERIDVGGHYAPGNVRWATWGEQAVNKRDTRRIASKGLSMTAREWERHNGWTRGLVGSRLRQGWNEQDAVSAAPRRWGR